MPTTEAEPISADAALMTRLSPSSSESLANTFISIGAASSSIVAESAFAIGASFTGIIVIVKLVVVVPPLHHLLCS